MALPNTYRRLDYIKSDGNQYLDLGFTPFENIKKVYDIKYISPNNAGICGARTNGYMCDIGFNSASPYLWYSTNTTYNNSGFDIRNTRYTIECYQGASSQYIKTNGTTRKTSSLSFNASSITHNEYMFAINVNGSVGTKCVMEAYSAKYYGTNDELKYSFIPAIRISDNVVGMYEEVNGTFHTNLGTGSFTYGSILPKVMVEVNPSGSGTITGDGDYEAGTSISLLATANNGYIFENWELDGYTRLDYIESSGTQYIDTGFTPSGTTRFDVGFNTSSLIGTTGFGTIFGSRQNHYTRGYQLTTYSDDITSLRGHFLYGTSANTTQGLATIRHNVEIVVGSDMHIVYEENTLTSNDAVTDTISAQSFTAPSPIYIFALNGNGSATEFSNTKLQFLLIYDNNVLVRNYIPVIRHSDGAIGLLDLVEMKFYGNSGTGTFIGGGVYAS